MKKSLEFIKEKIKNICLKLFNLGKKHKVLSIILCILIVVFCFKSVVWVYNDIAYGRFVKVGEKHIDDAWYSSLYETNYGTIRFFIPSNTHINNNLSTKKITRRLENFPVLRLPNEIYNINKDFIFSEEIRDGFFYDLDEEDKNLEVIRDIDAFDKFDLSIKPMIEHIAKNGNRAISICNNNDCKLIALDNKDVKEIIKLDDVNLLFLLGDPNGRLTYNRFCKYSFKNNELQKFNTFEVPYMNGLHNKLVYLGKNKFLFLQNEALIGRITNVILFTLQNDKFLKQELKTPANSFLFGFSTDNPLVLNENQVLFVGGIKGETAFRRLSKQCFLYDIQKNKIMKINDFPYNLKQINFLKTKDGNFYVPVVYSNGKHIKHFVYKYKRGRFVK